MSHNGVSFFGLFCVLSLTVEVTYLVEYLTIVAYVRAYMYLHYMVKGMVDTPSH
jgi:uncharacterized MAPEG superfamily protein